LYDEFGDMATKPGFDAQTARQYANQRQQAGNFNWNFKQGSRFSDQDDFFSFIFDDLFSQGQRGRRRASPHASVAGSDVEQEYELEFLQAIRGDMVELRVRDRDVCNACHGAGNYPGGQICHDCMGQGYRIEERRLKVRIPPGAASGRKIRIKGHGKASPYGGPPGDLILTLRVKPHENYRQEGMDVHLDLPITVAHALLGTKVKCTTPMGKNIIITIPKSSQGGTLLRVRGHGVQESSGNNGDFIIHLRVQLPAEATRAMEKAAHTLSKGVSVELPVGIEFVEE
ncbi:hypothetical protein KKF84_10825, partial [Myxococcota bacterium]|nr:hypothetical protein [Myxococcota bacterium]